MLNIKIFHQNYCVLSPPVLCFLDQRNVSQPGWCIANRVSCRDPVCPKQEVTLLVCLPEAGLFGSRFRMLALLRIVSQNIQTSEES
jgi:hypothetical protein